MDTLCINNITIYPGIKPPKGIVLKEVKIENFTLWITKCKNIYYFSESNHPIFKYGLNSPTYLLSHLFYIVRNAVFPYLETDIEKFVANNFLVGCLDYLKVNSANSYNEYLEDPVVGSIFFYENISLPVNPMSLSYLRTELKTLKFKQHTLKTNFTKCFKNFSNELEEMKQNIISRLSLETKETKETSEAGTQTTMEKADNVWKMKAIVRKTTETQTDFVPLEINTQKIKKSSKSIQTENIVSSIEIQTDIVSKTDFPEEIIPKKLESKKNKKTQDVITFTESEYAKIISDHKLDIEKAKKEGLDTYRGKFTLFVTKSKLPVHFLYEILTASDADKVYDAFLLYNMTFTTKNFILTLDQKKDSFMTRVPKFCTFWKNLILPRISKMAHPIMKILEEEWKSLNISIENSKIKFSDDQFNILFGHYGTIILTESWDLQSHIPTFFLILFKKCRNIPILLGLVNIYYQSLLSKSSMDRDLAQDFELLYSIPTEREILYVNRHLVEINQEAMRILYNLDQPEMV